MDGTVIGGWGHGRMFDPDKVGPQLVVPTPVKLATMITADGLELSATTALQLEHYKLHHFSYLDDDGTTQRIRLWMPLEITPNMAMPFLVGMAASAKPTAT